MIVRLLVVGIVRTVNSLTYNHFVHFPNLCVCVPSVLCGGTLNATTTTQTLTSPFFPNAYPPYTSCRWILDAPTQETIKVSVQTFALQPSQSCTANYLEMKDWPVVSFKQGTVVLAAFLPNSICHKQRKRKTSS